MSHDWVINLFTFVMAVVWMSINYHLGYQDGREDMRAEMEDESANCG